MLVSTTLLYIIITSIVLSWLRLREVNVRAVTLSRNATRLCFNYSVSSAYIYPTAAVLT